MTISAALSNALSGLTAVSRAIEVVSSNVSNSMTAGYARRAVDVSAMSLGGTGAGVRIDGISRAVNQAVLNDKRLADAAATRSGTVTTFYQRIEARIGQPGDTGSLGGRITAFETALAQASSRPDSEARLQAVVTAAGQLSGTLNDLATEVQKTREEADGGIATMVATLNASLGQIDKLNAEITSSRSAGRDASALFDQRQALVDKIAEIVPVHEVARENDQIALFTTGGAVLLEGNPVKIGFAASGTITADMTLASGGLSGLTMNGVAIPSTDAGFLGGGKLGAALAVRDDLAPAVQTQLDAMARNILQRFEQTSVDPTLAPGEAGLFTDLGAAFDPMRETGLAGRIRVNALVDPQGGGALWRIRDGLGAAAQGDVGSATLLLAMADTMGTAQIPASGNFIGAARSASGLASDILSQVASQRQTAEAEDSFTRTRRETLTALQLENGVDTDAEMQQLLQIKEAFSANAKVISTIDDLIQQLIGM